MLIFSVLVSWPAVPLWAFHTSSVITVYAIQLPSTPGSCAIITKTFEFSSYQSLRNQLLLVSEAGESHQLSVMEIRLIKSQAIGRS